MNVHLLPGLTLVGCLLLSLGAVQQDVVLTDPKASEQSGRTPAGDPTSVQVYDVKDIVDKISGPADAARADLELKLMRYLKNQEKAQEVRVVESANNDPAPNADGGEGAAWWKSRSSVTKDLVEVAQHHMRPLFEADREQLTVASDGMIVGNLRAQQHAWLAKFLDLQKRSTGLWEIAISVYQAPKGTFRQAGLKESSEVFDDPAALAAVRANLDKDDRISTVSAPRLAVLNGQRASLSVLDQVAYVKDWKLTIVEPGPQEIADPTIDIVQDGIVCNLRTMALDGDLCALDLSFVVSKLERPMATRKIRLSATNDREVEIGVPVVTKINFESKLVLANGSAAAFTTASPEKDMDLAIVLTLQHRALLEPESTPAVDAK